MELLSYLVLFSSALFGGLSVFLVRDDHSRRLKLILSFSGAYLFAITVLHLIPDVYASGGPKIGLFVLLGFGLQILLEQFSEGIEHGHIHKHAQEHAVFPFGIMISLCLHAFLEGMPLVDSGHHGHGHDHGESQHPLLYGIALHHIPAAFALGSVLLQNQVKKSRIMVMLVIFALMTPTGSFLSHTLQEHAIGEISMYFSYMMATVIGIFLHISTTILFESSVDHRFNLYKMIAITLGAGIAILYFLSF